METLCPDYPSFVDSTYLTLTGMKDAPILEGVWSNFPDVVKSLGSIQHAADGHEHLQIFNRDPVQVELEVTDANREIAFRLGPMANPPSNIGIVRRYRVFVDTEHWRNEDAVWRFNKISDLVPALSRLDHTLKITFSGHFDNIEAVDRCIELELM